ncbi:MAG: hypothetical protein R3C68_12930 [Myxococcota bacterium]
MVRLGALVGGLVLFAAACDGASSPELPLTTSPRTLDLKQASSGPGVQRVYGYTGQGGFGVPVAGGQDCTGDGRPDYAFSAMRASPLGREFAGEVYLVIGDGRVAGMLDSAVGGPRILRILGGGPHETTGSEIWMDDVTGDGLSDILIARQNFTPNASRIGAGALTIVMGSTRLAELAAANAVLDLLQPPSGVVVTTLVGGQSLGRLGIWMRTGDITGDGVTDLVVGADQEDRLGEIQRGALYVVRGGQHLAGAGFIDLADVSTSVLAEDILRIDPPSPSTGFHFGGTCQVADLDGNGRSEVLVAATINRIGAGLPAAGAEPQSAELFGGAPGGRVYVLWDDNFAAEVWTPARSFTAGAGLGQLTTLTGVSGGRNFGEEIIGGCDFDGNGAADLFVGDLTGDASPRADRPTSGIGYVLYDFTGLKGRDVAINEPPADVRVSLFFGAARDHLAADTAACGDIDGDGYDDLVFSAPHASPQGRFHAGMVYVFWGGAAKWPEEIDLLDISTLQESGVAARIDGARGSNNQRDGDTLGYSAAIGDVDGDGRMDLILNEMLGDGLGPGTVNVGNLLLLSGAMLSTLH